LTRSRHPPPADIDVPHLSILWPPAVIRYLSHRCPLAYPGIAFATVYMDDNCPEHPADVPVRPTEQLPPPPPALPPPATAGNTPKEPAASAVPAVSALNATVLESKKRKVLLL
jgi:hypothetical protein